MLDVEETDLDGVLILSPRIFSDARGAFCETFNADRFAAAGVDAAFVQDNQSISAQAGTLRGLHYQAPPFAQSKLVRVVSGTILDVVVDARRGSPTFGKWAATELSAESGRQIFVPRGFLHGFVTRAANTCVAYKVDAYYNADAEGAVAWGSESLGIEWGVDASDVVLSEKDAGAPSFADWTSPFEYSTPVDA